MAASSAVAVSAAGCLGFGDDDSGDENGGPDSETGVVEQFYQYLDEDLDSAHVDELFHSESPTASYWSGVLSEASADDGNDIVGTTARVTVENPTESDLDSEIGFAVDDQTFETILNIVTDAEESAIVEIDVELESNGAQTEETNLWVVATEDGEWQIVW